MKIRSQPVQLLPLPYERAFAKPPPAEGGVPIARSPGLPLGGPVYRVSLDGGISPSLGNGWRPPSSLPNYEKALPLLRIYSKFVADHFGKKGQIVHCVFFTLVDGRKLGRRWNDPSLGRAGRILEILRIVGRVLGDLGAALGLGTAEKAATTLSFVADLGDTLEQGKVTLSAADYAGYVADGSAGDAADALKLPEALEDLFRAPERSS